MEILKSIWDFIQNQVLGMKWLNELIGNLLSAVGLDTKNRWIGSLQFFIYDVIKIVVLLCFLIFIISYIQSFFPPERSKKILGRFHGIGANLAAALLGTVTPFCSCSSIPLFMGFTSAGLPLGVTFSFLISSPMVDLGSLVLLMSIFGPKVAIIYVILGLIIAVIGGTLLSGGVGTPIGSLFGVLIKGTISSLITAQGTLSSWWVRIVLSALLCFFIVIQSVLASAKKKE